MRNIFKKSFLLLATLVVGSVLNVFAYSHIGLANGTIALGTISKTPGAGNKFGKYQDGAYLYRGSAWSFSSGKGIKTQNSNSGVVFYLASPADITLSVMFDASKNFANVEATLYSLSDSDYDKFFTGTENSTTVTFSTTEVEKRTITIDKKATFQETFSSVGAGYYFVVCTGTGSNTYFTQLIVGGSTPVTPTVNSVTVAPAFVTLEPNDTQQLTATVDATPSSADKTVTWSSSDSDVATVSTTGVVTAVAPGSATITATSNLDNTKSGSCTVTVTAPAAPVEVESISMKSATTIAIGSSETLTVTYNPADANTGIALTWKSDDETIATVDANGKVTGVAAGKTTVTATTANGKSASCEVTVQAVAVTGVSLDKTAATVKIGSTVTLKATVTPADATNKKLTWTTSDASVASVNNGVVAGIKKGTATITVTTEDGGFKAECTVTVQEGDPLPQTDLTIHEPGVYEDISQRGGYGTKLTEVAGREYEVYYAGRIEEKVDGETKKGLTIHTIPADKTRGITKNETETSFEAIDGWFKGSGTDKGTGFAAKEEFNKATERCHTMTSSNSYELHIKGFDQFAVYAQDKKYDSKNASNNKYIKVLVDGKEVVKDIDTQVSIRRYDISAAEHIIRIEAVGDGNLLGGFSLRVAQVPSVKHVKGNDSTQVVLQTESMRNITYFTKYNSFGETKLVWEDQAATGIELTTKSSTPIGDTLILGGQALCPVGVYPFHISSFYNGIETKRLPSGKFTVTSDITAVGVPRVEVYQGETMDDLEFTYHALDASAITITWKDGNAPVGISGHGENGKYYISGTPTTIGDYEFTISVLGGNSIEGKISVIELVLGDNPVLYLYTNEDAYKNDGVLDYLTTKGFDFVPRKAKKEGLRPVEDYKKYNWVLISEDANADNAEVLALTRKSAILPVLNMKSFSYAPERLGWGDPDNGSLTEKGRFITVQRDDHPIFKALNRSKGSSIQVLSKIDAKGLMPVDIDLQGTFCLATSLTRSKENYDGDGVQQTFLHEVPAAMRGGKKYICLPIAMSSSKNLTTEGKQLLEEVVKYLLNDEPTIQRKELQITSFIINDMNGAIDQANNRITFEIDLSHHDDIDKYAIAPIVSVASNYTHVTPASREVIDFSESWSYPVAYEVSDYVNRRVYDVAIRFYYSEGIEDIYAVGDWVNIYDIYGRKITATNEDVYRMTLPRGIYIIVTETGETFKIMR